MTVKHPLTRVLFNAMFTFLFLASTSMACEKFPGKGKTLSPAKNTWNTGFFQAQIITECRRELGYEIDNPKSMSNPMFYQAVYQGDVDFRANGWSPNHNNQLPDGCMKMLTRSDTL